MGTTLRLGRFTPFISGEGDDYPMYGVSWFEAAEFANRRSARSGLEPAYEISGTDVTWNRTANGYRLPTEAEWEFAARGGIACRENFAFSGSNSPGEVAWYIGNSGGSIQPVGMLRPNALGLYDMSGNVMEWVWDWWGDLPTDEQATNPEGAPSGESRVLRGGNWRISPSAARTTSRSRDAPSVQWGNDGFRLVRPL